MLHFEYVPLYSWFFVKDTYSIRIHICVKKLKLVSLYIVRARVVDWVRAHRQFGVEFVTQGSSTWVFIRTWKAFEFVRVAVAVIDRYYGDSSIELKILGKVLCAIWQWGITHFPLWWLSNSGGLLQSVFWEQLHAHLCKQHHFWCSEHPAVSSKNCIGGLWNTRTFFDDRIHCYSLEGAEHRDRVQSKQSLQMAIETVDLSHPGLLGLVSKIIGVVATHCVLLKRNWEEGQRWKSFGMAFSFSFFLGKIANSQLRFLFRKKEYMDTFTLTGWKERNSVCPIATLKCVSVGISCHDCVVLPSFTCMFCMEVLGVNT